MLTSGGDYTRLVIFIYIFNDGHKTADEQVMALVVVVVVAAVVVTDPLVAMVQSTKSMSTTADSCARRLDFIAQGNVNARVNC